MKKKLTLGTLLFPFVLFAQCEFFGKTTIKIGEEQAYSIKQNSDICNTCYDWSIDSNKAKMISSTNKNTILLIATEEGKFDIHVKKGNFDCYQSITVEPDSKSIPLKEENVSSECNFKLSKLSEIKINDELLTFVPIFNIENDYTCNYEVIYDNGDIVTSKKINPIFVYSKFNPIKKVKIKTNNKTCYKEFVQNYTQEYWDFFLKDKKEEVDYFKEFFEKSRINLKN